MSDDNALKFNPDGWTLGDLEDFESITGLSLEEAFRAAAVKDGSGQVEKDNRGRPVKAVKMTAKTMMAIVLIEKRHDDETFTLDDAKKFKVSELVIASGDEPDPKGKPAKKPDSDD